MIRFLKVRLNNELIATGLGECVKLFLLTFKRYEKYYIFGYFLKILDEPETRDSWWNELRMEIRSHARAIGCNVVLGYSEVTTIT